MASIKERVYTHRTSWSGHCQLHAATRPKKVLTTQVRIVRTKLYRTIVVSSRRSPQSRSEIKAKKTTIEGEYSLKPT